MRHLFSIAARLGHDDRAVFGLAPVVAGASFVALDRALSNK